VSKPVISDWVRWLPAMIRTTAFAPTATWSTSAGATHQLVGARNDLHQGLAVPDDAADHAHGEPVDGAGLWRAEVDALELILGDRDPLPELGYFGRINFQPLD
jgi:hypothetical protein